MEQPNGSNLKVYLIALVGTLVAVSVGTAYGWPSPTIPKLLAKDSPIYVSKDQGSWMVSLMMLASVLGPVVSGYLVDKCGRKITLLVSAVPVMIGWILIIVANSVAILYASRVMSGISFGMVYATAPIYLGEIATDEVRGSLGTIMTVMAKLGVLVSYSVAPYVDIKTYAAIALTIPIIFVAVFIWFPESPYYLMYKNRPDDAMKSLKRLRGYENVKLELEKIKTSIEKDLENRGSIKELLESPGNRKGIVIIFGISSCIQLCGSQVIIAYSQTIFETASGFVGPTESTIILGIVQVLSACVASLIVDKLGRRPLLLISACGTTITTAAVGAFFFLKDYLGSDVSNIGWLPLTALIVFFFCYSLGLATVVFAILGEIFPANFKAMANSGANMYISSLGFGVTQLYPVIVDNLGSYVAFWTFSGCMMLGSIFIYFFVPETKGKSFLQIQTEMNGQKYDNEKT